MAQVPSWDFFATFVKKKFIRNCPDPKCKVAKQGRISKSIVSVKSPSTSTRVDPFQPYRSSGSISLDIYIIILKSALPDIKQKYTVGKVYLKDFYTPFPAYLARVYLNCELVKCTLTVEVSIPSCPYLMIILLLASDLADETVVPPLTVKD